MKTRKLAMLLLVAFILALVPMTSISTVAADAVAENRTVNIDVVYYPAYNNGYLIDPLSLTDVSGVVQPMYAMDGSTFGPLRGLSEEFGLWIEWKGSVRSIWISATGEKAPADLPAHNLVAESITFNVNGQQITGQIGGIPIYMRDKSGAIVRLDGMTMDNGAKVIVFAVAGTTYLPIRFIGEKVLGVKVYWMGQQYEYTKGAYFGYGRIAEVTDNSTLFFMNDVVAGFISQGTRLVTFGEAYVDKWGTTVIRTAASGYSGTVALNEIKFID